MNKKSYECNDTFSKKDNMLLNTYIKQHNRSYLPNNIINKLKDSSIEQIGISLLPFAESLSIAPISNFFVGAVAFDSLGNAYLGANFEFSNTHIGQTIHAEQSAIGNAWAHGAKDLDLLVINYPPCGHCRQFIKEVNLSSNFRIILPDKNIKTLDQFLPDAFGPEDLNIEQRILGYKDGHKNIDIPKKDKLIAFAKRAYKNSHAPYSGNYCGVAIEYKDNTIIKGYYGENAAFNPTLPALQMALNSRRLNNPDFTSIKRLIMIEKATNINQYDNAKQLLNSICDIEIEYYPV